MRREGTYTEISIEKVCARLKEMDNVVLLCHRNPDGDTIGTAFALELILEKLGKNVRTECNDAIPKQFSYMFRTLNNESFAPKNIVAVDIADESLFGDKLSEYVGKVDLCIDHHPSNKHYAKEWFVRSEAAATAEIIPEICDCMGIEITKDIANCVYTGVITDTGCFRYSNTTEKTHLVAGRMIKAGCESAKIAKILFDTKSLSRIAIERAVLNTIEYHFDRRCALVYITKEMIEKAGSDESELDGVASIPRQIEGVDIGITLREMDNGFKISLRTDDFVDASVICARLGGGGHRCASGCFVEGELEEAKRAILFAVSESLSEDTQC